MPEPDVYEAVPVSPSQLPSPVVICGSCKYICIALHQIRYVGIHYWYYLQIKVSVLLQYRKHYIGDKRDAVSRENLPEEP